MVTKERTGVRGRRLSALLLPALIAGGTAAAEPATYRLDPEHVVLGFIVSHIGFAGVLGTFGEIEGSFVFDEATGDVSDVSVIVHTESVDTRHEERDEHVKGRDFLDVRHFPTMTFEAASGRRTGERTFEITGELELLGQARPLTLEATWNKSGDYPIGRGVYVMGISARGTLRRGDFGMRYGLDNGLVGDEVEVIVELEARRQ